MIRNFMILFLSFFFLTAGAVAGVDCIQIEGLNLGCVSSIDHTCKMNRATDKIGDCTYGGGWAARYRVEGPISFRCKSTRNWTTEEIIPPSGCCGQPGCDQCTPERKVIIQHSECTEYYPPSCSEACVGCYENVQTLANGITRGCVICTRTYCGDEPRAETYCPAIEGKTLLGGGKKCSSDERCPTTAVDPLGKSHPVTVSGPSKCDPGPEPIPPEPGKIPSYCPWKSDKRTGGTPPDAKGAGGTPGNCECITRENWNFSAGDFIPDPARGCP